jgi:hypothetical protein
LLSSHSLAIISYSIQQTIDEEERNEEERGDTKKTPLFMFSQSHIFSIESVLLTDDDKLSTSCKKLFVDFK